MSVRDTWVDWRVEGPVGPLAGDLRVPGDKSIGHRAVLFGSLTEGVCVVSGLSGGEDNARTVAALRAMGVRIEALGGNAVRIHGVGLRGLTAPAADLDCGNSGTSMRLLAGLLAGQTFEATLVGDAYLHRRPMRRVAAPLELMGAVVEGAPGPKAGEVYPPLRVRPPAGGPRGISYDMPVASAQVKSAILIAGLYAGGVTSVREPGPTRDHTERMLAWLGAPVTRPAPGVSRVDPTGWDGAMPARDLRVPGDPSSSAFFAAAALVTGGAITVRDVCVNETRTGFVDVLRRMGARVELSNDRVEAGEPVADLVVHAAPLRAIELGGELVVRAIDELPVLAVVAAFAEGTTVIRDAEELRVKESDRVATTVRALRAFGVSAEERPDGLIVHGRPGARLRAAEIDSAGDHRIAMACCIAALGAEGTTVIHDVANVATSFPGFAELMRGLGASVRAG